MLVKICLIGSTAYSEMAKVPEKRQKFIESVITMLKKHNFDGLDLDWEYPGDSQFKYFC